ncbi:MAG: hypothetical protein SVM80_06920 [Halobacteriota archaeon]|nr:hypothetical protein [Halobacteriota archaeon]
MKRKNIMARFIVMLLIASVLIFSGCVEEGRDSDGDGWTDQQEMAAGTDIDNKDTDGDGYWDSKDENPLDPEIPEKQVSPTPSASPKPTAKVDIKSWHTVTSFSGVDDSSTTTTELFAIQGGRWRVDYNVKTDPEGGSFGVFLYSKHITPKHVETWECNEYECSGTWYIEEGRGDFYFYLIAVNIDNWELTVKDFY